MAAAIQSFRINVRRPICRIPPHSQPARSFEKRRCFKTFSSRRADNTGSESGPETLISDNLDSDEPEMTPQQLEEEFTHLLKKYGSIRQNLPAELKNAPPFREMQPQKAKPGALNMGVELSEYPQDDPEFEEDDITSMAHGQLEQHREFRHYARLAAWEMPLLTKMAKDFIPPTQKEVLRWRYTNYMGEQHPAEKKVVLEFCPGDMPDLTHIQREKLKKLAGTRWNPETDIIKISCEMFETQAQNKRYLGDLVDTLLQEARDPTDTFEDIPLDTRHHPIKVKPKFPVEWRMTDQRRAELETSRQQAMLLDQKKELQGELVDGVQQIQAALSARQTKSEAEAALPEMVMAGKTTAKGRKQRVRQ